MEGVLTSDVTLQQLALAAFIGPLASHEHRGSKVDQLVYLAIWSLARLAGKRVRRPRVREIQHWAAEIAVGDRAPNMEGDGVPPAVRRTKWS